MSEPSTDSVAQSMVRRNLDECRKALNGWYDGPWEATGYDEVMHDAVEALLRAVSELTRVVESRDQ